MNSNNKNDMRKRDGDDQYDDIPVAPRTPLLDPSVEGLDAEYGRKLKRLRGYSSHHSSTPCSPFSEHHLHAVPHQQQYSATAALPASDLADDREEASEADGVVLSETRDDSELVSEAGRDDEDSSKKEYDTPEGYAKLIKECLEEGELALLHKSTKQCKMTKMPP